uniref:xylosyltransferase 1-like isoform X2 n=1 Tax=Halichoerus grypus TaxID=9711 RepID=UPI001659FA1F|nr:xylosyltransferase 1-like isoform X2 [Halichoerus grypus]
MVAAPCARRLARRSHSALLAALTAAAADAGRVEFQQPRLRGRGARGAAAGGAEQPPGPGPAPGAPGPARRAGCSPRRRRRTGGPGAGAGRRPRRTPSAAAGQSGGTARAGAGDEVMTVTRVEEVMWRVKKITWSQPTLRQRESKRYEPPAKVDMRKYRGGKPHFPWAGSGLQLEE